MTLVIDASVAIKWVVRETLTAEARQLLSVPDPLIAPDWLLLEVASAFWRKVKASELLVVHAEQHLENMPSFFSQLFPSRALLADALKLSFRLRHPVYDCLYLALAQREDVRLVTADEQFAKKAIAAGNGSLVELLS